MLLQNMTWMALPASEILHAQGRPLSVLIYRILECIVHIFLIEPENDKMGDDQTT